MRRRLPFLFSLLLAPVAVLAAASSGCGLILGINDVSLDSDAGAPDAASGGGGGHAPDAGSPDFTFSIVTPNVTVPLDGFNAVEVAIQRTGGFEGEVVVALSNPPAGLSADPIAIGAGETSAEVVIGGQAPLAIGDTVSFTLEATADGLDPETATITDADVTGKPGDPDDTFGAALTGLAAVSFGSDDAGSFDDIAVVGGQILVIGTGYGGLGSSKFVITRLTETGALDPSFAGGALVRTGWAQSTSDYAHGLAIGRQVDGRIIGVGWREQLGSFPPDIGLVRHGADGSTGDPLFGVSGKSLIDLGGDEFVEDGVVLPNDRILAAGNRSGALMVARAGSSGSLDTAFAAPDGYRVVAVGASSGAHAVVVDGRNRILLAGHGNPNGQSDMVLVRLLQDGTLDPAFGAAGQVVVDAPADERARAAVVFPDGRILVAGDSTANGDADFQIRRFLEDGSPDPAFGDSGVVTRPITDGDDVVEDMIVLPDGKILVIGNASGGASPGPVVARYTRSGELDPHFGVAGVLSLFVGDAGSIRSVAAYPGHKVVISGGNEGGTPGPGTFGIVVRLWM
jgi:uncharacterized delta-60 repeat protein